MDKKERTTSTLTKGICAGRLLCLLLALCLPAGTLSGCRGNRLSRAELARLEATPSVPSSGSSVPTAPGDSTPVPAVDSYSMTDAPFAESTPAESSSAESSFAESSSSNAPESFSAVSSSTSTGVSLPGSASVGGISAMDAGAAAVNPYSCWYYDRLTADQQLLYRELYTLLCSYETSAELTPTAAEDVEPAFDAIRFDHPELFWLDNFTYYTQSTPGGTVTSLRLERHDGMSAEQRDQYALQLAQIREDILSAMAAALPADATQTQKAMWLFDCVPQLVTYVTGAPYNQTLVSSLLLGESVCAGYARAYQYLLNECGIFCTYISGYAKESHAWNLVQLDGCLYYSDLTWADSDHVTETGFEPVEHDFFAMTSAEIAVEHVPDEDIWPLCSDTAANWFRLNGTYMESWDAAHYETLLHAAAAQRLPTLDVQFATDAAWQEAMAFLQSNGIHEAVARVADTGIPLRKGSMTFFDRPEYRTAMLLLNYDG